MRIGVRQAEFDSTKEIKLNSKSSFRHINKRGGGSNLLWPNQILCFCFSQDNDSEYSGIAGF